MSKPDWGHGPNEPVPVWDLSAVTRVDVVDQDGVHEFCGDRWEVHLQDDGRTLKLIQKDGYGATARALRDVSLAKDLAKASPWMPMPPDGTVIGQTSTGGDIVVDSRVPRGER